jgi:hypothetical protein
MLEFIFGMITGVWMGQQFPLPSVQEYVRRFLASKTAPAIVASETVEETKEENEESVPLFTGQMPAV